MKRHAPLIVLSALLAASLLGHLLTAAYWQAVVPGVRAERDFYHAKFDSTLIGWKGHMDRMAERDEYAAVASCE